MTQPRDEISALDKLMARTTRTAEGCAMWGAAVDPSGYGRVRREGKMRYAHRVAYELAVGPVPAGMWLDHLCRERACIEPTHLEPVTTATNNRRSRATKLTAENVREIRRRRALGEHLKFLSDDFGVAENTVSVAARGITWADLR